MKNQGKSPSKEINRAVEILRRGGVVVFPTDTVFGIGCKVDKPHAIGRIRNIKKSTQKFPVLISNMNQAHKLAQFNTQALHLANKFWPGSLTIILSGKAQHEKIGLRMPDSEIIKSIIDRLDSPIIGTSANFHGQKTVTRHQDLDPRLIKAVDYVIRGECTQQIESTVVDATVSPIKILREGVIKIR